MNDFVCTEIEYLRPSRTIETILVTNKGMEGIFYVYNRDGTSFRLFKNYSDLISFFRDEKEADYYFNTERELDEFLGKATLHRPKSTKRTFNLPAIEKFLNEINCTALKADSSTKTDITIVVHDKITNQTPTLGFSIKSQLGSPSTLLNAGKTTNFIFKVTNIDLEDAAIEAINKITTRSKIKDRILAIIQKGGVFEFERTEKQIFSNNLILIDSLLPQILSHLVLEFYSSKNTTTIDLLNTIEQQNPLNFDCSNNHKFYSYKIKRLLTDIALGMMASKVWTGQYDATGGYLIVKESGDVLCYHIYNRNEFEDYLVNNTKLETASSSRHEFGELYKENDQFYFKLNLQIRFIK